MSTKNDGIEQATLQQLFCLIREEWQAISGEWRPWGVWMTLHTPLPAGADVIVHPTQNVVRAWFLQEDQGLRELSPWSFVRFWLLHVERKWDPRKCATTDPRFSGRCFPIGRAAFAPYQGGNDIYLETMWGKLYGSAWRLKMAADGQLEREILWIA